MDDGEWVKDWTRTMYLTYESSAKGSSACTLRGLTAYLQAARNQKHPQDK